MINVTLGESGIGGPGYPLDAEVFSITAGPPVSL
jgi:hypothetical protein